MSRAISAICPAISTPVGPAPTTTNVSQRGAALGVGLDLGRLEGLQDATAHVERALQRLQLGRVLLPFVVAEVGVLRAAGDDQRVVGERVGRGARGDDRAARPGAPSRSKPTTSASRTRTLRRRRKMRAQRVADLRRREGARRHLVGQRLEEVEVAPIDQRDVDRAARELQRGLQAAEAAADDDDAMRRALVDIA